MSGRTRSKNRTPVSTPPRPGTKDWPSPPSPGPTPRRFRWVPPAGSGRVRSGVREGTRAGRLSPAFAGASRVTGAKARPRRSRRAPVSTLETRGPVEGRPDPPAPVPRLQGVGHEQGGANLPRSRGSGPGSRTRRRRGRRPCGGRRARGARERRGGSSTPLTPGSWGKGPARSERVVRRGSPVPMSISGCGVSGGTRELAESSASTVPPLRRSAYQ